MSSTSAPREATMAVSSSPVALPRRSRRAQGTQVVELVPGRGRRHGRGSVVNQVRRSARAVPVAEGAGLCGKGLINLVVRLVVKHQLATMSALGHGKMRENDGNRLVLVQQLALVWYDD